MFSNIGSKIKTLAVVCCCVGMFISFVSAANIWSKTNHYHDYTGYGFCVLVLGCLASWIGSFFTYGFGQLIVHAKNIDEKLNGTGLPNNFDSKKEKMKQWLDEGLISEEEYNKSIGRKDEPLA